MKSLLLFALLLCPLVCQAAPVPDSEPPLLMNDAPAFGERVFKLPEDASAFHLSVFTSETPSAREQAIVGWFKTDPQLAKLWRQCQSHVYSPKSSIWSRYASSLPALPCVRLQKPDGTVVSQYSGLSSHLDSPDNLKRAIRADMLGPERVEAAAGRILPRRPHCPVCPNPDPGPAPYNPDEEPNDEPKPAVPDTPGEPVVDVVGPNRDTPESATDATIAFVVVAGIGALIAGYAASQKPRKFHERG